MIVKCVSLGEALIAVPLDQYRDRDTVEVYTCRSTFMNATVAQFCHAFERATIQFSLHAFLKSTLINH